MPASEAQIRANREKGALCSNGPLTPETRAISARNSLKHGLTGKGIVTFLFDASKPATLARRYEAEARRGFFNALKEFRLVEAEAAANIETAPALPLATKPARPDPGMGSFRENPPSSRPEPARTFPDVPSSDFPTVPAPSGQRKVHFDPPTTTA